ncbi:hypothetical protein HZA96_05590 [Candidatus Woesearchaeota archaeon]|nr:hypothetical protein [Candidatus Woesearchaeota archaeon]
MACYRFTLIDQDKRRVSIYSGYTGLLLAASRNPATVEEFTEVHNHLAGYPLYLEQRLSEKEIEEVDKERLADYLSTHETPFWVLKNYSRRTLEELAQSPNYKDYKRYQNAGTSRKPNPKGLAYDGVIVIDLHLKEISIRGRPGEYEIAIKNRKSGGFRFSKKKPAGKENEQYYWGFGFLSDLRKGNAHFVDKTAKTKRKPFVRKYEYELDSSWKIIDLKKHHEYRTDGQNYVERYGILI